MKIMKLVIGNSNNPYMTEVCTLKPVLNPRNAISVVAVTPDLRLQETYFVGGHQMSPLSK
jgi:hypothetical protein